MKKVALIIFVTIMSFFCVNEVHAQSEPANNLGKNITQLRQKFQNLRYKEQRDRITEYESDGIEFTLKNGVVVAETMGTDGGRRFGYNWFCTMEKAFKNTSYKRISERSDNGMVITTVFYYSNFWITLGYWHDDGYATITYQSPEFFK